MSSRFPYQIGVDEEFMQWARLMSGLDNPHPWVREQLVKLMNRWNLKNASREQKKNQPHSMLNDIERVNLDKRWKALGCEIQVKDQKFTMVRRVYVEQFGGNEDAALKELENDTTITYYRGWLMNWFKDFQTYGDTG